MNTRRLWMMWWAGLFALAAVVHVVRALANIPVSIGTVSIPVWLSWAIFPLAGLAAAWLMKRALVVEVYLPPRHPWEQLGGYHPKSVVKEEEPQHVNHLYDGVYVGYHTVGEDDEAEE